MKKSYDTVAFFYDRLSHFVFGDKLMEAQTAFLQHIPPGTSILLIGGGSGLLLERIAAVHPTGLTIEYIDASAAMVALSRERGAGNNTVNFNVQDVLQVALPPQSFDLIITPFLFDNFSEHTAGKVFAHLAAALRPGGHWYYTDFQNKTPLRYKVLLKIMYTFFRTMCGIEARKLPDVTTLFHNSRYEEHHRREFMHGFIVSCVFSLASKQNQLHGNSKTGNKTQM